MGKGVQGRDIVSRDLWHDSAVAAPSVAVTSFFTLRLHSSTSSPGPSLVLINSDHQIRTSTKMDYQADDRGYAEGQHCSRHANFTN